jgi:hypothetical protein
MQIHLIPGIAPLRQDLLVLAALSEAQRAGGPAAGPRRFAIAGPQGRAYRIVVCDRGGEWVAALSRLARLGFGCERPEVGMPLLRHADAGMPARPAEKGPLRAAGAFALDGDAGPRA